MFYRFSGTDQDNALEGSMGNDAMFGNEGNDTLNGIWGDDLLVGGPGQDVLDGGPGLDTAYYRDRTSPISVTLKGSSDAFVYVYNPADKATHHEDTLRNVENVQGGHAEDVIIGDDFGNHLYGFGGDDIIRGGSRNDRLYGHEGDDTLEGETGDDVLWGGPGNDLLSGGDHNDLLYGDDGQDVLDGGQGEDTAAYSGAKGPLRIALVGEMVVPVYIEELIEDYLSHIENIDGSPFDDTFTGDDQNNHLIGRNGSDTLAGGKGDDTLTGDKGNDTLAGDDGDDILTGGKGDDILTGGDGDDVLTGGEGDDTLTGGPGADRFVYDTIALGADVITDFNPEEGDKIDFSSSILKDPFNHDGSPYFQGLWLVRRYGDTRSDSLIRGDLDFNEDTAEVSVLIKGVPNVTVEDILL